MAMARTRVPTGGGELTHSCTGQVFASWQNSLLRVGEYCKKRRKNKWKVRGQQVPRGSNEQILLKYELEAMYGVGSVARDSRVVCLHPRSLVVKAKE